MRLLRVRVRTLMIAVALTALGIGSVGPGRQWYRRVSHYRAQAAVYARLEQSERLRGETELKAAADRAAIRAWLMNTPGFAGRSPEDQERAVDRVAGSHERRGPTR